MTDTTQQSYLFSVRPSLIKEWHPTKNGNLNPRNVTTDHDKKVWWICEQGHEWEATVESRVMGEGCFVCTTELVKEKSQEFADSLYQQTSNNDQDDIAKQANAIFPIDSPDEYTGVEYRRSPRHKYIATAMLEDLVSGNSIYAQMQNISTGGMFFETNVAFKPGTKIRITYDNPFSHTPSKISTSIVRWRKELEDDDGYIYAFGFGVKFS